MKERTPIDSEALIVEITRYLAAVEVFRAAGCEPGWRPELAFTGSLSVSEFGSSEAAAALGRRIGPADPS